LLAPAELGQFFYIEKTELANYIIYFLIERVHVLVAA